MKDLREFVRDHPHLKIMQDSINLSLLHLDETEDRCNYIGVLMFSKLRELTRALKDLSERLV